MTKKKIEVINEEHILSYYTDYTLLNGKKPNSVYEFAKVNGFEEADFYKYYSSFEMIEKEYFANMFKYTIELLNKNESYQNYSSSDKLTSFYFTFFEMATANRSFVKYLVESDKNAIKSMSKLRLLRELYLDFAIQILEKPIKIEQKSVVKVQDKVLQELSWLQFSTIFNFWLYDESPNFEKTDIFIEKSVKASFDLAYNIPTKGIIDLGKFLWKEQMNGAFASKN